MFEWIGHLLAGPILIRLVTVLVLPGLVVGILLLFRRQLGELGKDKRLLLMQLAVAFAAATMLVMIGVIRVTPAPPERSILPAVGSPSSTPQALEARLSPPDWPSLPTQLPTPAPTTITVPMVTPPPTLALTPVLSPTYSPTARPTSRVPTPTPTHHPACVAGHIITSPRGIDLPLSGVVEIRGTAWVRDDQHPNWSFVRWKIEYGQGLEPDEWALVKAPYEVAEHDVSITDWRLAWWDTTALPNGAYSLRLVMVKPDSNESPAKCRVVVRIAN